MHSSAYEYIHHSICKSMATLTKCFNYFGTGAFRTSSDVFTARFGHCFGSAASCGIQAGKFVKTGMGTPLNDIFYQFYSVQGNRKVIIGESVKNYVVFVYMVLDFAHNMFS